MSPVPSASLIGRAALAVSKQYHGSPRRQARHWPADGPPVEDDVVAHPYVRVALADVGDGAGRLVVEEERVVVADGARRVVQVGAADAAGGDVDDDLARARVGDDDVEQFDRRAPGS